MKNIIKAISVIALCAGVLTSCIKETFPQGSTATSEQISSSASALEASVAGISAQLSQGYLIYGSQTSELDMGIPGLFIAFTELCGDMFAVGDAGYDHYQSFNTCLGCGPTSYRAYVPWRTLYIYIKSANDIIKAASASDSEQAQIYGGIARVYRAFMYYMALNMYEPVANIYTDCSSVLGLTVPIVTEETTEEQARNNPRASHADMVNFILSDLEAAEQALEKNTPTSTQTPSLAVVKGLKAKVYLYDEKWDLAANCAEDAIKAATAKGAKPLTQTQWEDPNTGFNTANAAWLWHFSYSAENMGNLCNWIGWMSGEADWGYASLTVPGIDAGLYDQIPDDDWRKHSWLDPEKLTYYKYQSCRGEKWITSSPDYSSIKFRPVGGEWEDYATGGVCDVPLMRIEELYFIQAEARGHLSVAAGVDLLNDFMQKYRYKSYNCSAANIDAFCKEIYLQKRIEFWGEGITYFDAKRLNMGCKQSYAGTNAPGDDFMINCEGIKPNWNFMIPETEYTSNTILKDTNNPDPSGKAPKVLK